MPPIVNNKGIPQKDTGKKVILESSQPEVKRGKFGRKEPKEKKKSGNRVDRSNPEFAIMCKNAETFFSELMGEDFVIEKQDSVRTANIVRASNFNANLIEHLIVAFVADWPLMKAMFGCGQQGDPTLAALDNIKYALMQEVINGGLNLKNYKKYREEEVLNKPELIEDFDKLVKTNWDNITKVKGIRKASANQTMFADSIDVETAKYKSSLFIETTKAPRSEKVTQESITIQENYMEKPPSNIGHGFSDTIIVDYIPPEVNTDTKGKVLLPKYSIRVNGPGQYPVLSRFFGYVPDGKYLKSQHESTEAFNNHKVTAAESLAFFNAIPDIYSRVVHVGNSMTQNIGKERIDFNEKYGIRMDIARGRPVIKCLERIIQDMGFSSWESYWEWYINGYRVWLDREWVSVKFRAKYHDIKPEYRYNFPDHAFMGLNPCKDTMEKTFEKLLCRKEPPKQIHKWFDDFQYKYINFLNY